MPGMGSDLGNGNAVLIDHAIEDSFDVAAVTTLPEGGRRHIPHAFGLDDWVP